MVMLSLVAIGVCHAERREESIFEWLACIQILRFAGNDKFYFATNNIIGIHIAR